MFFGSVALAEAEGAILAHSAPLTGGTAKKGTVIDTALLARLQQAGLDTVTVARLEPGDVDEDSAAARLAAALVPDPAQAHLVVGQAFTGRVNLNAAGPGVAQVDADAVAALNAIDPSITLATLPPLTRVGPRTLVGTVKIISYGVDEARLQAACDAARAAVCVQPVVLRSAGLVLTEVPGQKSSLSEKGAAAMEGRLRAMGMELAGVETVPHETDALAAALRRLPGEIALILTGSATSDLHDVGPQAVRVAGGSVNRFGMPVDPGNLLFVGSLDARAVVGLPGCARSPALNGADWVLERLACGIAVGDAEIAAMGVGGLLKEIPLRPQPREP